MQISLSSLFIFLFKLPFVSFRIYQRLVFIDLSWAVLPPEVLFTWSDSPSSSVSCTLPVRRVGVAHSPVKILSRLLGTCEIQHTLEPLLIWSSVPWLHHLFRPNILKIYIFLKSLGGRWGIRYPGFLTVVFPVHNKEISSLDSFLGLSQICTQSPEALGFDLKERNIPN